MNSNHKDSYYNDSLSDSGSEQEEEDLKVREKDSKEKSRRKSRSRSRSGKRGGDKKKDKKKKKDHHSDKSKKSKDKEEKKKKSHDKDSNGIRTGKLHRAVKKFFDVFEDDLEDFKGIFSSLDDGEDIDISELENKSIREKLLNIFEVLKLKQKTGTQIFKKGPKNDFSLDSYMNNVIAKVGGPKLLKKKSNIQKNQRDNENDDNDDSRSHSESSSLEDRSNEQSGDEEGSKAGQQRVLGPTMPSSAGATASGQEQQVQRTEDWLISGGLDNFLEGSFKEVEASEVKKYLTNKAVGNGGRPRGHPQVQQLPDSKLARGSAPLDLESIMTNDEDAIQAAEEYEKKYRAKTLMEIHQESLMKKKQENSKQPYVRKPFDRETDLSKKTDSKKVLAAIKEQCNHGPKFQYASQK